MNAPNYRMLREWFILRFRKLPEQDTHYFKEWYQRYERGEEAAIGHMDINSRSCWQLIKDTQKVYFDWGE